MLIAGVFSSLVILSVLLIRINQIGDRYWKLKVDLEQVQQDVDYLKAGK
ncbi:MAG: hypothetical protein LKI76_07310 [Megasphaera sp.]|jgi:cell division protein FtsB|nr:hypothetical protein [Megasphaera sp.]